MLKRIAILMIGLIAIVCLFTGCQNEANANTTSMAEISTENTETYSIESSIPDGYKDGDLYGTLNIDDISMHLNVYCADIAALGTSAQEITDAEDSAAFFKYGKHDVIADHDYQGFDKILEVTEGMKAVINLANGKSDTYECVSTAMGYNAAEMFIKTNSFSSPLDEQFDEEVVNLFDFQNEYLVMYTCNGSTQDIYITFWKQI